MYYNNILEVIGNTPLVKINKLNTNPAVTLLAKLEFMNPGGSIKDRIGITMLEKAKREGRIKKGGTLVEPTSGNTGVGLAIASAIYGYKCIFVMPDKMSEEKRNLLRAYGAKVVITPTAVTPKDPRSYYQVSNQLAQQNGNYKPDQYSNPENPAAHYQTTGPEIWRDTEGKVTHVVIGMGTGGTISGVGKFLKEKNPKIKIIGVDPVGSVYFDYFITGKMPKIFKTYKVEGVEGLLAGGSSGMALFAAIKLVKRLRQGLVVVILPDSGRNYLTKFYNDDWMKDYGYLEKVTDTINPLLNKKLHLITVSSLSSPQEAIELMRKYQISQMPVVESQKVVGTITEGILIQALFGKEKVPVTVSEIMDREFIQLTKSASISQLVKALSQKEMVIIVDQKKRPIDVLTRIDLLSHLSKL